MVTNYTTIIKVRQHFGNEEDYLKDVEPGLPFVGSTKDYHFDCPNVDQGSEALLMFQTRDVDHNKNIIQINPTTAEQPTIFGGIPVSPNRNTWNGNIMLVRSGVLRETDNELRIESRNEESGEEGDIDDFIIDNVVILYKTKDDFSSDTKLRGDYRALTGLSISSGTSVVTASSDVFTASDVGKTIVVHGAGIGTDGNVGDELVTTIKAFTSATQVTVNDNASYTVENVPGGMGTDNSDTLQNLLLSEEILTNRKFIFNHPGNYFFASDIKLCEKTNIHLIGNGVTLSFISANPHSAVGSSLLRFHLFRLTKCENITFENFVVENVGQTNSRPDIETEYGYYEMLNGVLYNRHYNKFANNGLFVSSTEGKYINVLRCKAVHLGGLIGCSKGTGLLEDTYGGLISENRIEGWGSVAILPGNGMRVINNFFTNEDAPAISFDDRFDGGIFDGQLPGTSHVCYSTSGFGDIVFSENTVEYCRGVALQWRNTKDDKSIGNRVQNNTFIECWRNGNLEGRHSILQVNFEGNSYHNCGSWTVNHKNGDFLFHGEQYYGKYSENDNAVGAISINKTQSLKVFGCSFEAISSNNKGSAIVHLAEAEEIKTGNISIAGNYCHDDCDIFFAVSRDHSGYAGKCIVKGNTIGAQISLGRSTGTLDAYSTPGGREKYLIEENTFFGTSKHQIEQRFSARLVNNIHHLTDDSFYAISIKLRVDNDNTDIIGCHFYNDNGSGINHIELTEVDGIDIPVYNNERVALIGCKFYGTSILSIPDGHEWRFKSGNYSEATNTFDSLPV